MAPIARSARRTAVAVGLALFAACAHAPVGLRQTAAKDGTRVECRGGAAEVRLIGSFNAWSGAVPLSRDSEGRFAARLELPPGRALLACQRRHADGSTSTEPPVNAPSVEDDGFGGRNGVFEIEGPPAGGGERRRGAIASP